MARIYRGGQRRQNSTGPVSGFEKLVPVVESIADREKIKIQVDPTRNDHCEPQCVLSWKTQTGGECTLYVTGTYGDVYAQAMCWQGYRMAGKRKWTSRTFDMSTELGKMVHKVQDWANSLN